MLPMQKSPMVAGIRHAAAATAATAATVAPVAVAATAAAVMGDVQAGVAVRERIDQIFNKSLGACSRAAGA